MTLDRQDSWDWLLVWASEMGSGSWDEWKAACDELELEPNEAAQVLSKLGHAEFDWGGNTFACAAGTLVEIAGLEGQYVLTGSRLNDALARLRATASAEDFDVEVSDPISHDGRGPATILVECSMGDSVRFAKAAGLAIEEEAGLLAGLLPTIRLNLVGERSAPDLRFPHCRIDHESLRPLWGIASDEAEEGLWLVRGLRRFQYYIRAENEWWHIPIREFAPYLVSAGLADPPLIEYEEANWLLHVRSCAALPPLHARAATLCSGRLPLRRRRADEYLDSYVNVGPGPAVLIMRSLGLGHESGEEKPQSESGLTPGGIAARTQTPQFECVFRPNSATDSVSIRPAIPIHSGHRFRFMAATPGAR